MTTIYDIPADSLISELAKELKANKNIEAPEWAQFAMRIHPQKSLHRRTRRNKQSQIILRW